MSQLEEYKPYATLLPGIAGEDLENNELNNKIFEDIQKVIDGEEVPSDNNDDTQLETEVVNDEPEDLEDESPEELAEEEEVPKKERKNDIYRKLQNDKYRALAEKAKSDARIAELEAMLDESLHSSTYHYGKNVYSQLERAKENKSRALEGGDLEALKEADLELMNAVINVRDLERWEADNKIRSTKEPAKTSQYDDSNVKQEMALDWLDTHPYLKPNSRSYDSKLYSQVNEFVNYLNDDLQRRGEADMYATPEYFDTIDAYINDIKAKRPSNVTNNVSSLPPVGGVRSSYTSSPKPKAPKVSLSAVEKELCKNAGISEELWLENKIKQQKELKGRITI